MKISIILLALLLFTTLPLFLHTTSVVFVTQIGSNLLVAYSNGTVIILNPALQPLFVTQISFSKIVGISEPIAYPWGSKLVPSSFQHRILVFLNSSGYYGLILPTFFPPKIVLNNSNISYIQCINFPITAKKVIYISPYYKGMESKLLNDYLVQYNRSTVLMFSLSNSILESFNLSKGNFTVYTNATVVNNVVISSKGGILYPSFYHISNLSSIYFYDGKYFYVVNGTLYENGIKVVKLNFTSNIVKVYTYNSTLYIFFNNGYVLTGKKLIYIGKDYSFLDDRYIVINDTVYSLGLVKISPKLDFYPVYFYNGIVISGSLREVVVSNISLIKVKEVGLPPNSLWVINDSGVLYYSRSVIMSVYNFSNMSFYSTLPYYVSRYYNNTVYFRPIYYQLIVEPQNVNFTVTLVYTPLGNFRFTLHSSTSRLVLPVGYYVLNYQGSNYEVNLTTNKVVYVKVVSHTKVKARNSNIPLIFILLVSLAVFILLVIRNILKR